jgi:hypothetical protein
LNRGNGGNRDTRTFATFAAFCLKNSSLRPFLAILLCWPQTPSRQKQNFAQKLTEETERTKTFANFATFCLKILLCVLCVPSVARNTPHTKTDFKQKLAKEAKLGDVDSGLYS